MTDNKPRDIFTVINQINLLIPDNTIFKEDIIKLHKDCSYTSPETISTRWNELHNIINLYLIDLTEMSERWEKDVINIYCNELIFN